MATSRNFGPNGLRGRGYSESEIKIDSLAWDLLTFTPNWVRREVQSHLTVYTCRLWCSFTDNMAPSEANDLAETLGIDHDTEEHVNLEKTLSATASMSRRK
jgi:hypothetical protein